MWTLADDNDAWSEGWWVGSSGIIGNFEFVKARAAEGSELHSKAIQHVALCKLTNTNPTSNQWKWNTCDEIEATQEGWGMRNGELYFSPNFYPSKEVFMLYIEQNAVLFRSILHMKALRNTR